MPDDSLAFLLDLLVDESIALSDHYQVGDLLGEGRFSQVRKAKTLCSQGEVALKGIAVEELDDEEALQMLENEVAALRRAATCEELRRHVVCLHRVVRSSDDIIYLVMDLVGGSELFLLVERHGALPEPIARLLLSHLVLALAELHRLGVAHRDVKPENLMVSGLHSAATACLVLIDFGFAAVDSGAAAAVPPTPAAAAPAAAALEPASTSAVTTTVRPTEATMSGLAGTPGYAAPEVLIWLEDEDNAPPYSCACDVWSLGVTAYVLLAAQMPLVDDAGHKLPDDCTVEQMLAARPRFGEAAWGGEDGEAARDFVAACMRPLPADRPTAAEALQHRWLVGDGAPPAAWPMWPPETGLAALAGRMRRASAFAAREGGGALQRVLVQRPGAALASLRAGGSSIRSSSSGGIGAAFRSSRFVLAPPPSAAPASADAAPKGHRRNRSHDNKAGGSLSRLWAGDGRAAPAAASRDASPPPPRPAGAKPCSAAAEEGLALLKRGAKATKLGRSGKPRGCVFRLSADERSLAWEAHGLSKVVRGSHSRAVVLADVVELTVGQPSPAARLPADCEAHLCLSLLLLPALPPPPASGGGGADAADGTAAERETLDIALQDEESFGLWIAALRALIRPLLPDDPRRRLIPVLAAAKG